MPWDKDEFFAGIKKAVRKGFLDAIESYSGNQQSPIVPKPEPQGTFDIAMDLMAAVYCKQQELEQQKQAQEQQQKMTIAEQVLNENFELLTSSIEFLQYEMSDLINICRNQLQNDPEKLKLAYETVISCLKLTRILAPNDAFARFQAIEYLKEHAVLSKDELSLRNENGIKPYLKWLLYEIGGSGSEYRDADEQCQKLLEQYIQTHQVSEPEWFVLETMSQMRMMTPDRYDHLTWHYVSWIEDEEDFYDDAFERFWNHFHSVDTLCRSWLGPNCHLGIDCDWNDSFETWKESMGRVVHLLKARLAVFHFGEYDSELFYSILREPQVSALNAFLKEYELENIVKFYPSLDSSDLESKDKSEQTLIFNDLPDNNSEQSQDEISDDPETADNIENQENTNADEKKSYPKLRYSTSSKMVIWAIESLFDDMKPSSEDLEQMDANQFANEVFILDRIMEYLANMLEVANLIVSQNALAHFRLIMICRDVILDVKTIEDTNELYNVPIKDVLDSAPIFERRYETTVQFVRNLIEEHSEVYRGIFADKLEQSGKSLEDCVFEDLGIQRETIWFDPWLNYNVILIEPDDFTTFNLEYALKSLFFTEQKRLPDMPGIDWRETEKDVLKRWSTYVQDRALVKYTLYCDESNEVVDRYYYFFTSFENTERLDDYIEQYIDEENHICDIWYHGKIINDYSNVESD